MSLRKKLGIRKKDWKFFKKLIPNFKKWFKKQLKYKGYGEDRN